MRVAVISEESAPSAGVVKALDAHDTVVVRRSATLRHDWAALAVATMVAYARGAHVEFVTDHRPSQPEE